MEGLDTKFKKSISLKEFEVSNSLSIGRDEGFNVTKAEEQLIMSITKLDNFDMEFDMIGYDAGIANALRRILLLDVPCMAIEKVYMYQNTSIMQDDHLSHRLGLLPLNVDPRLFSFPATDWTPASATDRELLEFSLSVKCSKSKDTDKPYSNEKVFTRQLEWVPRGEQEEWLPITPACTAPDILINKLRPGHEMDIKLYAIKGTGRDHAKFSPVATAFYRLLPSITIIKPLFGEAARKLQKCFSPGVIDLVKVQGGDEEATVVNQRIDSCSRNVHRYEDLRDCVVLDKVKDHFIFTVESVGGSRPEDLVSMAWDVMIEKCDHFIGELQRSHQKKNE